MRERCETYKRVRSEVEGRPYALGEAQAVMRNTYVAPTMEEARRVAEEGIMSTFTYNDPFRGMQVFMNPGEELTPDMKLDWDFLEPRALLVGPPVSTDRSVTMAAELGLNACYWQPPVKRCGRIPQDEGAVRDL